ncbi:hypothetical protein GY45DRAFT_685542 [Cubamyces sp. BRFM 1775]|nr:hypothetical protein GY45DRAFT_685542 [Cubamyces sp. BRFM 1775]
MGHHSCEIEVWDWKAGELVWTHTFGNQIIFSFLDPFHIAVIGKAFNPPRSLHIHRVVGTRDNSNTQRIGHSEDLSHVCTVALPPPIHPNATRIYIDRITCNTRPTSSIIPLSDAPFAHDPASALVTIQFTVFHKEANPKFLLVIPARTLYREMERASSCAAIRPPSIVPWTDWGPCGSLLLPLTNHNRQNYLSLIRRIEPFGSRFALPFHIPHEPRDCEHVVVLDFTRSAARRNFTGAAALDLMRLALLDGEEWKDIFAESVVRSTLPYRAIVGPDVTLVDCQAPRPVSVRMVVQPDGFTIMYARSRRDGGPRLDMYHI